MTTAMWIELILMITATVALAYVAARIDIELIHRKAKKQAEHEHTLDLLRRK